MVSLHRKKRLLQVEENILQIYYKKILRELNISNNKLRKFTANLHFSCIFLHFRNLKLHLKLRTKLTKIHRALKFKPTQSLKPDIDYDIQKR